MKKIGEQTRVEYFLPNNKSYKIYGSYKEKLPIAIKTRRKKIKYNGIWMTLQEMCDIAGINISKFRKTRNRFPGLTLDNIIKKCLK